MITDGYEEHCISLAEQANEGASYEMNKSILCECLNFALASKNSANLIATVETTH